MNDIQYFEQFEKREPPAVPPMSVRRTTLWHVLAGITIGLSFWYLHWRWASSLNPDAIVFSTMIAIGETLFFAGTLLFFFDIWEEGDTPQTPVELFLKQQRSDSDTSVAVDVFITTYDEELAVVEPSILAAKDLKCPNDLKISIWILDDGNRAEFSALAKDLDVGYLSRADNIGFKAGNLKNALIQTNGDFVAICDADTRVFPEFLINTLGYFHDPKVAWVQTPHWFYDLPEGQSWDVWVANRLQSILPIHASNMIGSKLAPLIEWITGLSRCGDDPFMSEPALFFDVIQRRRNRNGASFCCGAGSIHRREALFQGGLAQLAAGLDRSSRAFNTDSPLAAAVLQPFKFHVSEDIYTSIKLQSDPRNHWISVFHPQVESRMLSPWSLDAWATQKLKYAGGTFDVMLWDNPIFKKGMPWRTKLHYAATFWSYLSVLWVPIMLLAPVLSLFTSWAPVKAYSLEFFSHILPVLLMSELAMVVGCKGYNINIGRVMAIGGLGITSRALWQVIRGQKPRFPPTPKTPLMAHAGLKRVMPNVVILAVMASAASYGIVATVAEVDGYSLSFLLVNLFWLFWNALSLFRVILLGFWSPAKARTLARNKLTPTVKNQQGETKNVLS